MPRMYVRPESGNRTGGRYLADDKGSKGGIRRTHSDDTNYFDYDSGNSQNIVRRTGSNDVRGYNDLGKAFKPLKGPEDVFTLPKPKKLSEGGGVGNPFPLKSNKKTIAEFKNGVFPGASTQMRMSASKIKGIPEDYDPDGLNAVGKVFHATLPPEVAMGDSRAMKEYLTSTANFEPALKPPSIDMEPIGPEKPEAPIMTSSPKRVASVAKKASKTTIADNNLPALIERNDYFPDGSKLEDRMTAVYENTGYVTMHHRLGANIFRTLNTLSPFIKANPGELRSMGQNPTTYHDAFKAKPTSPLRLYLKSKGFDSAKIDSLLNKDILYFRNNDFSLAQLKAMDKLMDVLEPLGQKGGEFERFLKIVPEENRKEIKEPYDLYSKRAVQTIRNSVAEYKKFAYSKPQQYVRRILLDHENAIKLDAAMNNLGQLEETKETSYLLDHHRNTAQAGIELLNAMRTATSYSQGTVFTHPELLKYTSEIPPLVNNFLKALKRVGDDKRINQHPEFVEKYSDLIFTMDKIMSGPLLKDLEIWRTAAKAANPIPTNSKPVTKGPDIMRVIDQTKPQVDMSSPKDTMPAPMKEAPIITKKVSSVAGKVPANTANAGTKSENKAPTKASSGNSPNEETYLKYATTMPQPYDLVRPLGAGEQIRPAPFDDPFLRETQNLAEWSDYASKMKAKLDTLNQIGNTIQEMALVGTGRPDPELVALGRRRRRLSDLNDVVQEVPKTNRISRSVEQGTLKAQHDYVQGVGKILTERLKIQAEEANQRVKLDQMAAKSATGLASKALETSLDLMQYQEKLFNVFMQLQENRDKNTWRRIKSIVGGFKF